MESSIQKDLREEKEWRNIKYKVKNSQQQQKYQNGIDKEILRRKRSTRGKMPNLKL